MSRDPFIVEKLPQTALKILSTQISWKEFFQTKVFFNDLKFFSRLRNRLFGSQFFSQKLISYFFLSYVFNFTAILKTCFKSLFRKKERNCWFYSFKWVTQTLQDTLKEFCFPDCWKDLWKVHVFKNVLERSTAKHYCYVRPLSIFSKSFEKLINNNHLENCGLIVLISSMASGLLD